MTEIPLPNSTDDIYSLGFDKSLNRIVISSQTITGDSALGYSGITNEPAQGIGFGALAAGIGESMFIMDPSKGLSLGSATFEDAPFQVDMEGNLNASTQKLVRNFTAGEAIAIGDAVYTSLYQSDGGVQWDSDVDDGGVTATSVNVTVGSNDNRLLIAFFTNAIGAPSPSYNGTPMTLVASTALASDTMYMYRLVAPSTGTNSLSWSNSSYFSVYSFYGVDQTTPLDSTNSNTGSGGTVNAAVTSTVEGDILLVAGSRAGGSGDITASPVDVTLHENGAAPNRCHTAHTAIQAGTTTHTGTVSQSGSAIIGVITTLLKPFTTVVDGVFRADASVAATADPFCGFAENTASANTTVKVAYAGTITNLSGLTRGALYYLSDTTGAISTSAGTVTRKVGIALGRSLLLITNLW